MTNKSPFGLRSIFYYSWCFLFTLLLTFSLTSLKVGALATAPITIKNTATTDPYDTSNTIFTRIDLGFSFSSLDVTAGGAQYLKLDVPAGSQLLAQDASFGTATATSTSVQIDNGSVMSNGVEYDAQLIVKTVGVTDPRFMTLNVTVYKANGTTVDFTGTARVPITYKKLDSFTQDTNIIGTPNVAVSNSPNVNVTAPVALTGAVSLNKVQIEKGVALFIVAFIGWWFIKFMWWRRR